MGPLLASSWHLLAFSWLFLASSGLFLASSGLFLPLPASSGLFLASFWPFPGFSKISKIQGLPETSFSVRKTLRFEQFFAKFWIPGVLVPFFEHSSGLFLASSWPLPGLFWPLPGLFWPLPGLFWPLPGLFWPLPGLFWPLFGLFLDSPKSPKFRGPQTRHFLFIKHCVSSSFSPNSGFLASSGLFLASSGLFLASSGPLLASSWLLLASSCPLLASFWLFPRLSKISKIQALPETSFSVHKTLRFEQFFAKFWIPGLLGPFCQKPCIPGRLRSVRTCSFPSIAPGPR